MQVYYISTHFYLNAESLTVHNSLILQVTLTSAEVGTSNISGNYVPSRTGQNTDTEVPSLNSLKKSQCALLSLNDYYCLTIHWDLYYCMYHNNLPGWYAMTKCTCINFGPELLSPLITPQCWEFTALDKMPKRL